jgi:hypothetical protein
MMNRVRKPALLAFPDCYKSIRKSLLGVLLVVPALFTGTANAQEVRYSWLDLSYKAQNFDRQGTQVPVPDQSVDIDGSDGSGVRFRGSIGIWKGFYGFIDYGSVDIDVAGVITNEQGEFLAEDEFDLTTIRGGLGFKYSIGFSTDLIAEFSYDSIDLDFGSFAGENFDTDDQDSGGLLGIRSMLNDDFELRAWARYTNHETVDLDTGEFDTGSVYGAGFGWEFIRGLSIVGDYESGQFANWSIGFRLDLDED